MAGANDRTRQRGGARRPYTIRDQIALRRLDGFTVAPDGRRIVLRVTTAARGRNRLDHQLWLVNRDGSGLRRLRSAGNRASNPVFASDGRLYALTGQAGADRRIVRLPLDGGSPERVTDVPLDIESFVLSRDGRRIAFAAMVIPAARHAANPTDTPGSASAPTDTPTNTIAATISHRARQASRAASGRLYDRLLVRHWDEWKDGRRRHIFVQEVAGGSPVDVMPVMDADAPTKPFGGPEQYTFTPDGSGVIFTARDAGADEAWSTDLDLFLAPADGSLPPRPLTGENSATDTDPSFSPDGRMLAYLAMDRPTFESDKQTVILRGWPAGQSRRLTDGWDRSVDSLAWAADGGTVYVAAQEIGQRRLFAIDVETGGVTTLVHDGHVSQPTVVGETVFFINASLAAPAELWALEDGRQRRITNLNDELLARVEIGVAEQFAFPGWHGETVHGYLIRPAGFEPDRRYPIAFLIHGGPQGSLANDWGYRWNPQVYAGAGYAVVMIDFHGSTGYGQAFTDSISGDWGGKPLEDLQKGYAYALERYPFLDPARAAALGASFGGFMVNLIAGVWNEPWRCLVAHDGNLDERFAYFATEELWFPEWEHGGTPWENPEGYERDNPVHHVASWRVPMLIIHGARDYRVSDVEGLATFTALQRRGIPSRLLYFPDENHWVLKPENSIQWHETVLDWLARWTASEAAPPIGG